MVTAMTDPFDIPADVFDSPTEHEPGDFLRIGRWNRPSVVVPMRDANGVWISDYGAKSRVDYPRVTTICDQLSSGPGLTYWKTQHVALAVAKASRGVRLSLAGKEYGDPFVKTFVDKACEQAKLNEKADTGTAVGRMVEPGAPREYLDPEDDADLITECASFDEALTRHGMSIIDTQILCVQDDLRVAGTADFLVQLPDPYTVHFPNTGKTFNLSGRVVIGDNKRSGGKDLYPVGWTVQEAFYANSRRYNDETDERSEIHENLDTRVGVIFHIHPDTGRTEVLCLDLEIGWHLAHLAKLLHSQGKGGKHLAVTAPPYRDPMLTRVKNANDKELRGMWERMTRADKARYFADIQERLRNL